VHGSAQVISIFWTDLKGSSRALTSEISRKNISFLRMKKF
jgi:hypothetical protein